MINKNKSKKSIKTVKVAYEEIKKVINKNINVKKTRNEIKKLKKHINQNLNDLNILDKRADCIKSKSHENFESILEAFPIETLRESCGDFSKRVKYKDISELQELGRKANKLLDNQIELETKEKALRIELLQNKIESLINNI